MAGAPLQLQKANGSVSAETPSSAGASGSDVRGVPPSAGDDPGAPLVQKSRDNGTEVSCVYKTVCIYGLIV